MEVMKKFYFLIRFFLVCFFLIFFTTTVQAKCAPVAITSNCVESEYLCADKIRETWFTVEAGPAPCVEEAKKNNPNYCFEYYKSSEAGTPHYHCDLYKNNIDPGLCCPDGFSTDACQAFEDRRTTCCRDIGVVAFREIITKQKCGTSIDGKYCCPSGYSWGDCPIGTDRTQKCCKFTGLFQRDIVDRIYCSLQFGVGKPINILKPTSCDCVGTGAERVCSGIQTSLGCFPTDPKNLVSWLFTIAIGIGGGTAFLMALFGAFLFMTSGGDPEKLKEAQATLTASITGILLIIFAVFLLRLIGFTILKIPGWK